MIIGDRGNTHRNTGQRATRQIFFVLMMIVLALPVLGDHTIYAGGINNKALDESTLSSSPIAMNGLGWTRHTGSDAKQVYLDNLTNPFYIINW